MFEWLNKLKPGNKVVIRDFDYNRLGQFPAIEFVEVVTEITDDHIKTAPLQMTWTPPPRIDVWTLFSRRFGSSNQLQLIRKAV